METFIKEVSVQRWGLYHNFGQILGANVRGSLLHSGLFQTVLLLMNIVFWGAPGVRGAVVCLL